MAWTNLPDLGIEGRRVFIRVDLDLKMTPARGVADPARINDALPTVRHALAKGARVILGAHLGRPRGRSHPEFSLEPIGALVAEALGQDVVLTDEPAGDGVRKVVADLRPGAVAMLENLRFSPGEEANEESFSQALASYTDVYVNDALAASHRSHASVVGLPRHVSERAAGLVLDQEKRQLTRLLGMDVPRPFVVVLGGSSATLRLPLIEALLDRADALILGGAVGNTFLQAGGSLLGRSLHDGEKLPLTRSIIARSRQREIDILLPTDLVAAAGTRSLSGRVIGTGQFPDDLAALDIGPETARRFAERIAGARTIFWNGPMGAAEAEPFASGTRAVARAIAESVGTFTVASGADTIAAIRHLGLADRFGHLSGGGDATLEFLEGKKLPGMAALEL